MSVMYMRYTISPLLYSYHMSSGVWSRAARIRVWRLLKAIGEDHEDFRVVTTGVMAMNTLHEFFRRDKPGRRSLFEWCIVSTLMAGKSEENEIQLAVLIEWFCAAGGDLRMDDLALIGLTERGSSSVGEIWNRRGEVAKSILEGEVDMLSETDWMFSNNNPWGQAKMWIHKYGTMIRVTELNKVLSTVGQVIDAFIVDDDFLSMECDEMAAVAVNIAMKRAGHDNWREVLFQERPDSRVLCFDMDELESRILPSDWMQL